MGIFNTGLYMDKNEQPTLGMTTKKINLKTRNMHKLLLTPTAFVVTTLTA